MRFSERIGLVPSKIVQHESMDNDLRNSIWNILAGYFFINRSHLDEDVSAWEDKIYLFATRLWSGFFKLPIERLRIKYHHDLIEEIKNKFYNLKWYEIYDLIEYIVLIYAKEYKEMPLLWRKCTNESFRQFALVMGGGANACAVGRTRTNERSAKAADLRGGGRKGSCASLRWRSGYRHASH